jgi:hypothetical protein
MVTNLSLGNLEDFQAGGGGVDARGRLEGGGGGGGGKAGPDWRQGLLKYLMDMKKKGHNIKDLERKVRGADRASENAE